MIDGDGSMVMSSLYYYGSMQANWSIANEKSAGVGSDGMIKMIFLYFIYATHVFAVDRGQANEISDYTFHIA